MIVPHLSFTSVVQIFFQCLENLISYIQHSILSSSELRVYCFPHVVPFLCRSLENYFPWRRVTFIGYVLWSSLEVSFWINEINQSVFSRDCNKQLYKSKYFFLLLYWNFFFAVDDVQHSEILLTLVSCIVSSFSIFQHRASSIGNPVSNILLTVDRERSLSRDQSGSQDLQIFRRATTFTRKPFSVRGV